MSALNLVTALAPHLDAHLGACAASVEVLRGRLAPLGWSVRWLVAVDGPDPVVVPGADVVVSQSAPAGVSACRNLALSHAVDGWVFRLDADDVVDADGWAELLGDPLALSAGWCATNVVTVEGDRTAHWFDTPSVWPRRSVEEAWSSPMPFHPNNVVVRTELALAAGGWPALRVNEDIGWCFAVSRLADGRAHPAVTLRYRRWAHQTVADDGYLGDKAAAFEFLGAWVNASRRLEGLADVVVPAPSPAAWSPRP